MVLLSLSVANVYEYSSKEYDFIDKFSLKSRMPSTVKPLSGGSAVNLLIVCCAPLCRSLGQQKLLKIYCWIDINWGECGEMVSSWAMERMK